MEPKATESHSAIQEYLARGEKVTRVAPRAINPQAEEGGVLQQLRDGQRDV